MTAATPNVRRAPAQPPPAPAAGAAEQATVDAQHVAFDEDIAERAELEREEEALESLVMAQLKNEDEIMKKWIALI
jgi:hypothetical protein